jgi:RNA-directed DNA polymerase
VKPRLRGKAFEIRYADDGLLCFQFKEDAERVLEVLPKRFAKYGLTLHPEKTRLVQFGRSAYYQAKTDEDQDRHVRLPGFHAPVCNQPGW